MDDLTDAIDRLQTIVNDGVRDADTLESNTREVRANIDELPTTLTAIQSMKCKCDALRIWDTAVLITQQGGTTTASAALRHAAAQLMARCVQHTDMHTDENLTTLIKFYHRTAILYTQIDASAGNTAHATLVNKLLDEAHACLRQLDATFGNTVSCGNVARQRVVFKLFMTCAEQAFANGKEDAFRVMVGEARKLVQSAVGEESATLATFLSNVGVELQRREQFAESIEWLTASHEVYDADPAHDAKRQAWTLNLLALARYKTKRYESALDAVTLANQEERSALGLFQMARATMALGAGEERVHEAVHQVCEHADCDMQMALELANDAAAHKYEAAATLIYDALEAKYSDDAESLGVVRVRRFAAMLHSDAAVAAAHIDELLARVESQETALPVSARDSLYATLFNEAAAHYDRRRFHDAVDWLRRAHRVQLDTPTKAAACLRQLARCSLLTKDVEQARRYLNAAEQAEATHELLPMLRFELCVACRDHDGATNALKALCAAPPPNVANVLAVCAKDAHENGCETVATQALGHLLDVFDDVDEPGRYGQFLQTLVALTLPSDTATPDHDAVQRLGEWMHKAVRACERRSVAWVFGVDSTVTLQWFTKIAWNMAIHAVQHDAHHAAEQLFGACRLWANAMIDTNEEAPAPDEWIRMRDVSALLAAGSVAEAIDKERGNALTTSDQSAALTGAQRERVDLALQWTQQCAQRCVESQRAQETPASNGAAAPVTQRLAMVVLFTAFGLHLRANASDERLEALLRGGVESVAANDSGDATLVAAVARAAETGAVLPPKTLRSFAEMCRQHGRTHMHETCWRMCIRQCLRCVGDQGRLAAAGDTLADEYYAMIAEAHRHLYETFESRGDYSKCFDTVQDVLNTLRSVPTAPEEGRVDASGASAPANASTDVNDASSAANKNASEADASQQQSSGVADTDDVEMRDARLCAPKSGSARVPAIEWRWLLTKCYNRGINLWRLRQASDAERWLHVAVQLLERATDQLEASDELRRHLRETIIPTYKRVMAELGKEEQSVAHVGSVETRLQEMVV